MDYACYIICFIGIQTVLKVDSVSSSVPYGNMVTYAIAVFIRYR